MEEILTHTVIVELPQDLGMDDVGVFAFSAGEPWEGWTTDTMAHLVRYLRPSEEGRRPAFRITLRRTRVRSRLPLLAADKTFHEWVDPLLSRRRRLRRKIAVSLWSLVGLHEVVTVAAISAFIPTRTLPEDLGPAWTDTRISEALEVLNRFLVCLGVEANDEQIGPLYRTDLPARVPTIVETQPVPTPRRVGADFVAPLHNRWPTVLARSRDLEDLERAAALFRAAHEGDTPWFATLELTHTARRDGVSGRYVSAILGAGTAIEVLASTIVTEVGKIRGWSPERITGANASGLKNIISHHVQAVLEVPIDLSDKTSPWGAWWEQGYSIRNKVAHEGHRPTEAEAQSAVYSAMRLVAAVGQIVEADPTLEDLTVGLPTGVE